MATGISSAIRVPSSGRVWNSGYPTSCGMPATLVCCPLVAGLLGFKVRVYHLVRGPAEDVEQLEVPGRRALHRPEFLEYGLGRIRGKAGGRDQHGHVGEHDPYDE